MFSTSECVNELLEKYNKQYNDIARKPTKDFKGLLVGRLFEVLLSTSSLKEASEQLNCCVRTIQRTLLTLIGSPASERGGNIRYYLLASINKQLCNKCSKIKSFIDFSNDSTRFTKHRSTCKSCGKEAFATYYENNREEIIANVSLRTEHIKLATPEWADKEKIRKVYKECPEGMHVDHVIPLRGSNVSGLHIDTNLQYLSPKDNLSKSNKYMVG